MSRDAVDLAIIGAGAAGLATAIFAARRARGRAIVVFDGARRIGAKILISGGGRCNVTNRDVSASDFWGGPRRFVESVLRAFPAARTVGFFDELGVRLHEEERGKLFPDSNRARTVLDAMLEELRRLDVPVIPGEPVVSVAPDGDRWRMETGSERWTARRLVLATGGLSVPKTGSDGSGLRMAASLGHTIVPTTPALVALVLEGSFHAAAVGRLARSGGGGDGRREDGRAARRPAPLDALRDQRSGSS